MEIHKGMKTKQDLKMRGIQHFYMSDNDVIQKLKGGEKGRKPARVNIQYILPVCATKLSYTYLKS